MPRFFFTALALLSAILAGPLRAGEPLIEQAWIRALPPTQPVTAAYLVLRNPGPAPVEFVGATVEGAGRVEIHTSVEENGLRRMERLSTLTVAPGESRALAPGGVHLMLFELDGMPREGESRRLCVELQPGGPICTDAQVLKSADPGSDHQHHH